MASREKKDSAREKPDSEMMRRFKSNPFLFIGTFAILIIVVIAFVVVPAVVPEQGMGGSLDLTFGYYDKVPIGYVPGNYLARYYDMLSRWQQSMGQDTSFMSFQMWRESFEVAAVHTAMLQEMKRAGYTVPPRIVDREMASLSMFQENGRFSPALYRQMDENRRLSLWRQTQEEIATNQFRADMGGLLTAEAEAEFIGRMAAVERSFEMAVIPVDSFPEEEFEAFAQENTDLFRTVHLSMITVGSNEREANRLLASIRSGETTFEDAARAHSRDSYAERGGDMGIRMFHELDADIPESAAREIAASLAMGEYSEVITTANGWFFFRAEENAQESDISDPSVMERIRSYMRGSHMGMMEDWAIEQAEIFIALVDEIGFEEALSEQGIESRSFGPIPVNFGNIDLFTTLAAQTVAELSGSEVNDNFWRAAFATPVDSPSQPLVQGGNVLVLFPTAETEAEEESLEDIASTFSSFWLANNTEQSLRQHFLNSPKMEDNFFSVYFRYFMGN